MQGTPVTIASGTFSGALRVYQFVQVALLLVASIAGIALLPIWLILGPLYVRRAFAALRCDLTERSVVIGKGLVFRRELTIPLDKIQDISIREGPLLSSLGLLRLKIETAGQSGPKPGGSDADLIGLVDARGFRDHILRQRDAITRREAQSGIAGPEPTALTDIRDSLLRIEALIAAGGGAKAAPIGGGGSGRDGGSPVL